MELCAELGIAFLPWSPLGGISRASTLGGKSAVFERIGAELGASPQQVCLAWELSLAPVVIPIPGASRPASIRDSARASDITLSNDQIKELSS